MPSLFAIMVPFLQDAGRRVACLGWHTSYSARWTDYSHPAFRLHVYEHSLQSFLPKPACNGEGDIPHMSNAFNQLGTKCGFRPETRLESSLRSNPKLIYLGVATEIARLLVLLCRWRTMGVS